MIKIPLTVILVVVGVAATIGVVVIAQDRLRFQATLENKALLLTRAVAATVPEAILRGDHWSLYQNLRKITLRMPAGSDPDVVLTGMVLDTEGRVLAHLDPGHNALGLALPVKNADERSLLSETLAINSERIFQGESEGEEFIEAAVPIDFDGKRLGVARIRLSTVELREQTIVAGVLVLGLTLGLAAVGSLLGCFISRRLVRPLDELACGMDVLGRADPAEIEPLRIVDRDEIGRLTETFNRLAQELAEKKRLEQQLAQSEKLAGLGRISVGLAHEVNNPLGGMLNCLNTLKKRPDDPVLLRRYLDLLETGLRRIERTVKGLLVDLRSDANPTPCGLSCLPDLEELVAAEIGDRPIQLRWRNELENGFCYTCSCPQIQQVILNLAMNGIQAMPDGGELSIGSHRDGNVLVFDIEDNGVGIAEADRKHLFDPFFTGKSNGTGLGLWITYRLVERMGGVIEVDSEVGLGSRFRVRLPIAGDRPEEFDALALEKAS